MDTRESIKIVGRYLANEEDEGSDREDVIG